MGLKIDLEECDVDKREVEVDELEQKHLEGVAVLELCLCPRLLPVDEPERHVLVQLVEEDDDEQVEGGGHQGGEQPGLGEQHCLSLLVLLEGFPGNIANTEGSA